MSATEKIEIWQHRIDLAYKELTEQSALWDKIKRVYMNSLTEILPKDFSDDEDYITVNLLYAYVKTHLPDLYSRDPYIKWRCRITEAMMENKEKMDEMKLRAEGMEVISNYYYRELNCGNRIVKPCLLDVLLFGLAIAESGYHTETVEDTLDAGEYSEYIKKENPISRRVSPKNFLRDVNCKSYTLEDASWAGKAFLKPLNKVKANKKYKNTSELKTNLTTRLAEQFNYGTEEDFQMCLLFEIWDKENMKHIVMAHDYDKFLFEGDNPFITKEGDGLEGFPYSTLAFNPVPEEFYPIPDIVYVLPQITELSGFRNYMMKHIKRFNRKYEVHHSISDDDLDRLQRGEDGAWIRVQEMGRIKPIEDASLPAEIYNFESLAKSDFAEILGSPGWKRGGNAPDIKATLGDMMAQGVDGRTSERIYDTQDFLKDMSRKQMQILQVMAPKNKMVVASIIGEDGEKTFAFNRDKIAGEFDNFVELISTHALHKEMKRKHYLDLFNFMANPAVLQMLLAEGYKLKLSGVIKEILMTFDMEYTGQILEKVANDMERDVLMQRLQGINTGGKESPAANLSDVQRKPLNPGEMLRQVMTERFGSLGGAVPSKNK